MSDTTYVQEITRGHGIRVTLTMDASEARAMADIASAAIDACVLLTNYEGENEAVQGNAENVYKWATKAAHTLDLAMGPSTSDDQE
jgi:hypothetical protein